MPGRIPQVAAIVAVGLLLCAVADDLSRATLSPSPWLYWGGVGLIAGPIFYRLCDAEATTTERLTLVCMLGLGLYMVKLFRDPYAFTLTDEFPHSYNLEQILSHHRLFGSNPLLPITADYPGLEGATSALAMLTGMSSFGAGIIMIGAARLTLMVALFGLFSSVSRSSRVAGLAAALFAGNANFLLWEAQFAYESLALPLLVVVLACLAERETASPLRPDLRPWAVAAALAIAAIAPTHHLTGYLLIVILLAIIVLRLPGRRHWHVVSVGLFAVLAVALTVAWLLIVASATIGYISPVVTRALAATIRTVTGEAPPRTLLGSSGGTSNDLGESVVAFGSVLVLFGGLVYGLRAVWRWQRTRPEPLVTVLALAAIGYFGVTALRFAPSAWEVSNRLAEFMFIGLAFVIACAPLHRFTVRGRPWAGRAVLAVFGAIIVIGAGITGWPANTRMANPLIVTADGGRIQSETVQIGKWVQAHLRGDRFVTPDADAATIVLYGRASVLTGSNLDSDYILTSPTLQPWELARWRRAHVHYVVIDLRKRATDVVGGYYFSVHPPAGPVDRLLPASVATRFDRLPAPRIFDSGHIMVYDLQAAP